MRRLFLVTGWLFLVTCFGGSIMSLRLLALGLTQLVLRRSLASIRQRGKFQLRCYRCSGGVSIVGVAQRSGAFAGYTRHVQFPVWHPIPNCSLLWLEQVAANSSWLQLCPFGVPMRCVYRLGRPAATRWSAVLLTAILATIIAAPVAEDCSTTNSYESRPTIA